MTSDDDSFCLHNNLVLLFLQIVFSLIPTSMTHPLSCQYWVELHLARPFSEFSYINCYAFYKETSASYFIFLRLFLYYFYSYIFVPWTLALRYIVARLVFGKNTIVKTPLCKKKLQITVTTCFLSDLLFHYLFQTLATTCSLLGYLSWHLSV